eukprot:127888_1
MADVPKATNVKSKIKALNSKQKSNKIQRSSSHKKLKSGSNAKRKAKSNKKKKKNKGKKKKRSHNKSNGKKKANPPSKMTKINVNKVRFTTDASPSPVHIQKTNTSPIHSPSLMAHESIEALQLHMNDMNQSMDNADDDVIQYVNYSIDNKQPSPFQQIKEHKLMQKKARKKAKKKHKPCATTDLIKRNTKQRKKKKKQLDLKRPASCKTTKEVKDQFISAVLEQQLAEDKINLSYFSNNYFSRNASTPKEIAVVLDRIETDMKCIFSDSFLCHSIRTKKIYTLSVSIHKAFSSYKLSFLLPVCRYKLMELDGAFVSVMKYFNRLKRYYRSPSRAVYCEQITQVKNAVDGLIHDMESHCSIVLYALIRSKQLYIQFSRNTKLLIFWISLFPDNELEFVELSWCDFVHRIHSYDTKFESFSTDDMIHVLTANYEVLSIDEFIQYVMEYESVDGWLKDMYSYIGEEIAHPHKNKKHKQVVADHTTYLEDVIQTAQQSIQNAIQCEVTPRIETLFTRLAHMEQSLTMIRTHQEQQRVAYQISNATRMNSMIIHDSYDSHSMQSDDSNDADGLDLKINIDDELPSFESPQHSNDGTVVIHATPTPHSLQCTPLPEEEKHKEETNQDKDNAQDDTKVEEDDEYLASSSSSSSRSSHHLIMEEERESWNKTVRALEAEISELRTKNYEQSEQIRDYELRLDGVTLKSKQFFTLQSKLDYHEKLSLLIKNRCFALHQQLSKDLVHNKDDDIQIESKYFAMDDALQNAITQIFSIHQQLKDLCVGHTPDTSQTALDTPDTPQPTQIPLLHHTRLKSIDLTPISATTVADATDPTAGNRSRARARTSYGRAGPQSRSANATPHNNRPNRRVTLRQNNSKNHTRQLTFSVSTLREINDESVLNIAQPQLPDKTLLRETHSHDSTRKSKSKNHLRGRSVANMNANALKRLRIQNANSANRLTAKKIRHGRYKTAALNYNVGLLSPHWAANIALNNVSDYFDDGVSDVISTLSNIDYTYDILNNDDDAADYVNIFADEHIPLHLRSRSYRFPGMNATRYSIVDPVTILDDDLLSQLQNDAQSHLKPNEVKMKTQLVQMLREMDLMGEGRLDIADFASGIMNAVMDYDDIMEDAQLLFETMQNLQDDMGAIKIGDLVNVIMLNEDDGAAKNIKQQMMIGLGLNEGEEEDTSSNTTSDHSNEEQEEMPQLIVKPIEVDPDEAPLKPIYALTNGIQKIGVKSD